MAGTTDTDVSELIKALEKLAPEITSYSIDCDSEQIVIPQTYEEFDKNGRKTVSAFRTCTITLNLKNQGTI
jgi:hypothetical protein